MSPPFIMTALFLRQTYNEFVFATIVFLVAIITCSEVTILMVYYRLNHENHKWWWPAFFCGGSIGFYMFLYSFVVWGNTLEMSRGSAPVLAHLLYNGEILLISFGAFLLFGDRRYQAIPKMVVQGLFRPGSL